LRFPVPLRLIAIVLVVILIPSILITALGLFAVYRAEPMVREQLAYPIEQALGRLQDRLSREWEFRLQDLKSRIDSSDCTDDFFSDLVRSEARIIDVLLYRGGRLRRPLPEKEPPLREIPASDPQLQLARELEFRKGDPQLALATYRAVIADGEPELVVEALFGAARCLVQLGEWRESLRTLRNLADRFGETTDITGLPRSLPAILRIIEISREHNYFLAEQLAVRELVSLIRQHRNQLDDDQLSFYLTQLRPYTQTTRALMKELARQKADSGDGERSPDPGKASPSGRSAEFKELDGDWLDQLRIHAGEREATETFGYVPFFQEGGRTAIFAFFHLPGEGLVYLRLDPASYLGDIQFFTPELDLPLRSLSIADSAGTVIGGEGLSSGDVSDLRPLATRKLPRPLSHLTVQYHPAPGEITEELRQLETSQIALYTWSIVVLVLMIVLGVSLTLRSVFREMRLTKLKSDFVGFVTHELKTPLTAIRMFTETLILNRVESEEERRRCVELIDQEAWRLSRLIEQILEFSRMERRQKVFHFVSGDMAEVVDEAVKIFLEHNLDSRCEIEVNKAQQHISRIKMDRAAMVELLLNLLSNALKYSRNSKKILVNVRESINDITVEVVDQGIGIPKWEQRKIFGHFYRAEDYLTRDVEGTGLGLTFARYIAKAHSGDIKVTSAVNQGSTFTLELRKNQILAE